MDFSEITNRMEYLGYVDCVAKDLALHALEYAADDEPGTPPAAGDVSAFRCMIEEQHTVLEWIDSLGIMIYYSGHDVILEHTANEDYAVDNFGTDVLQADSFQQIKQNVAVWAFYADVQEALADELLRDVLNDDEATIEKA